MSDNPPTAQTLSDPEKKMPHTVAGRLVIGDAVIGMTAAGLAEKGFEGLESLKINIPNCGPCFSFAVVTGALLGGAFGLHETRALNGYRHCVNGTIKDLRHQIQSQDSRLSKLEGRNAEWANRVEQDRQNTGEPALG